jgi:hypothetical protein
MLRPKEAPKVGFLAQAQASLFGPGEDLPGMVALVLQAIQGWVTGPTVGAGDVPIVVPVPKGLVDLAVTGSAVQTGELAGLPTPGKAIEVRRLAAEVADIAPMAMAAGVVGI